MYRCLDFRWVCGSHLFLGGNYIFNHYIDCKDENYFLCSDRINDIVCLPLTRVKEVTPVLACQDRVLRVLDASNLLYEVEVAGPPQTLCLFADEGGAYHFEKGERFAFTTNNYFLLKCCSHRCIHCSD